MTDRYEGKPFLRLLDCYIMDAIGHLDPAQDAQLTALEPKFREVFGAVGDWRQIVEHRMDFAEGMQDAVRQVWEAGTARFIAEQGHDPDPAEFTRIFVDSKFPH
ncbi:MAG: hypothetical protein ABW039_04225 [Sphingobium sp.]